MPLPHPVTNEPGVWIPPWVQRLHLDTDLALKTCSDERGKQSLLLQENVSELSARSAAIDALEESILAANQQLLAESRRAQEAENTSEARLVWALIATGGVLVAGTILAISAAF